MKTALTLAALLMGTAGYADTITVAGGCFWCTEADFEKVHGVSEAVSSFAGVSHAAIQRNLSWLESQGLVKEVTG